MRIRWKKNTNTQITWDRVMEKRFYYVGSKVMFFCQRQTFSIFFPSSLFVSIWHRDEKKNWRTYTHNWVKMIRWSSAHAHALSFAIQIEKSGNLWKRKYINDLELEQHLIQHVPPNKLLVFNDIPSQNMREKNTHTQSRIVHLFCT